MLKFWKYTKYIENYGLNKRQYCFANISATKAPIFMKFDTEVHQMIENYHKNFRKDPYTHARTWGVNVRAHVYESCAHVYARIFTKNHLIILYYMMNKRIKFHKDRSFRCRDICKLVLTFVNHQFSMYFPYYHNYVPQKSSRWIITKELWNFLETRYQNVPT